MSEGSSDQEKDYSVTIDENGIFEFADKNVRNERLRLILRKLLHEHTMRTLKNKFDKKGMNDKDFIHKLNKKINKGKISIDIIKDDIVKIQEDYIERTFGKNNTGIATYLPKIEKFPGYFNDERNQRVMELNKILKDQIKNELTNGIEDDLYKNLLSETIDEYGETIYKDGKIAAQSIDFLKSKTEQTLFWSVCGEGMFGMLADAAYADLMAFATGRETMAQIRERLNRNGINMSSTNDEFSAVSAFIALNAKGEVYIASKPGVEIGQYISEIEIPILLKNPNVTKISLINVTDELLTRLKYIGNNAFNVKEFNVSAGSLINENIKVLFKRDEGIGDIAEKTSEIVNKINNFAKEEETPIKSSNDNIDKPIDEGNYEEESEQNVSDTDIATGFEDIFEHEFSLPEKPKTDESSRVKLQDMTKKTIIGMTREELSSEDYKKDFIEIMDEFEENSNDIDKKELIDTYIKKVYPNIINRITKDLTKYINDSTTKKNISNLEYKEMNNEILKPLTLLRKWEKDNSKNKKNEINGIIRKLNQKSK